MNTSMVSKILPVAAIRSTPVERVVLNLPKHTPGSEDVTVRRELPKRLPNDQALKPQALAPVIRFKHLLAGVMLVSVVGCGTTSGDRMVSGAGIGAGAGAVLGAVTGMGPGTGAAIGAAAGAATGGLTKQQQVNLGKPIWR